MSKKSNKTYKINADKGKSIVINIKSKPLIRNSVHQWAIGRFKATVIPNKKKKDPKYKQKIDY